MSATAPPARNSLRSNALVAFWFFMATSPDPNRVSALLAMEGIQNFRKIREIAAPQRAGNEAWEANMIAWPDRVLPRMLALAAASWVGCTMQTRADTIDELYQKAKAEKTVVLYGAGPTGSHDRWIKEFEQRFPGVTVTFTGGLSTALNKKIEAQLANQKVETDLAILQTIQDFAKWKKAGAMLPFKPAGWDPIDEAYKDEDGAFVTVSVNAITYAINTQLVAPADVPKSALDFLKPMFAGKLITTDPTDDDAALAVFTSIVQKYGWDYMDKYAAQKPAYVTTGHAAVSNAIVSGDKLASFDSTSTTFVMHRDRQADRAGVLAGRRHADLPGRRRHLQGRAPSQRGEALPHLVSRQGAAEPLGRLLGARGRAAARRACSRCRPTTSTAATGNS